MDAARAQQLLGGLSAAQFMRSHWQTRPLLVRGAIAEPLRHLDRRRLFSLAAEDDVESRLVIRDGERWSVRSGPLPRRALPPIRRAGWTLLVQGVDLHDDAAHALLRRFRFLADARLDDVMLSFASDGGGVGPHLDSYDVFLLQIEGRRRWRVGRVARPRLRDDVPLKMLASFTPRHDWLLAPGDMLYLPPGCAHEGTAVGPCITCSIGFRAPRAASIAGEVLLRLSEAALEGASRADKGDRYADPGQAATRHPARIPPALQRFADRAVAAALRDRLGRHRALGEVLSEPKPGTWFARREKVQAGGSIVLDRRTRMLYDEGHIFINGESYRTAGADATLMRRLADERCLVETDVRRLGRGARELLARWDEAGWCARRGERK